MSQLTLRMLQPPDLLGKWQLRRRIADRRAGLFGTVAGELTLAETSGQITWSESGTLHWAGADHPVTRTYLIRPDVDGWWLYFSDRRPFHPWQPGVAVEHLCRADLYRGTVAIRDGAHWGTVWDVIGPAKDLRIVTRLSPQ